MNFYEECMKGLLALDIDGTLTDADLVIPKKVNAYLASLYEQGWKIAFLTGRTYSFAMTELTFVPYPYLLGVQNGTEIISLPNEKLLHSTGISHEVFPVLEKMYQGQKTHYLAYAGYLRKDFCYWDKQRFEKTFLPYLQKVQDLSRAPWEPLSQLRGPITLIKCFGTDLFLKEIKDKMKEMFSLNACTIKDGVDPSLSILLLTPFEANKGKALHFVKEHEQIDYPVIAAGNDYNDITLFEEADISVGMEGSCDELLSIATIVAPHSHNHGIIDGLTKAIDLSKNK